MAPSRRLVDVRRIAVFRALQLGDLLCAVPALRALRGGFPDAEVTLLGLPWSRELVPRFASYLDDFLEFPGFPGLPEREPDVAAFPGFLADAHARRFDLVVQLHGAGDLTNPIAVLLGGRRTAGLFRPGSYCPDPETFVGDDERLPEPRRLLRAVVEGLGLPSAGEDLEFPVHDADRAALDAVDGTAELRVRRYACIHPGARNPHNRWDPASFAVVADGLAARGLDVVLTGSESERAVAEAVTTAMRARPLDLCGRTSLGALAALVEGADVVLCNDTGVSHLAAALRVPSVVVFSVSPRARSAPLDRRLHRAVRRDEVTVEDVLREVDDLLREHAQVAT